MYAHIRVVVRSRCRPALKPGRVGRNGREFVFPQPAERFLRGLEAQLTAGLPVRKGDLLGCGQEIVARGETHADEEYVARPEFNIVLGRYGLQMLDLDSTRGEGRPVNAVLLRPGIPI